MLFANWSPLLDGVWWASWQPGVGLSEPEKIPGTEGLITAKTYPKNIAVASDGTMFLYYTNDLSSQKLLQIKPGGAVACFDFSTYNPPDATGEYGWGGGMHAIAGGAAIYAGYVADFTEPAENRILEYWRWQGDNWSREQVRAWSLSTVCGLRLCTVDSAGREYAIVARDYTTGDEPQRLFKSDLFYFYRRLDPRIGP